MTPSEHIKIIEEGMEIWGKHPECLERIKEVRGYYCQKPLFQRKQFKKPLTYREICERRGIDLDDYID